MGTDQNKDVVRRFINEVLMGGHLDRIDDLLSPDYVNRAFGADLSTFKGMLSGLVSVLPERRFDIEELVAEGDAVVARYTSEMRDADGKAVSMRGLTYYRLRDGKIGKTTDHHADLAQELAPLLRRHRPEADDGEGGGLEWPRTPWQSRSSSN